MTVDEVEGFREEYRRRVVEIMGGGGGNGVGGSG